MEHSSETKPNGMKLKCQLSTKVTMDLDNPWLDASSNENQIIIKVEEAVKFIMANLRSTSSLRRRYAALALRQVEILVRTVDMFKKYLAQESDVGSAE